MNPEKSFTTDPRRLVRRREVLTLTGLSTSTLYRRMAQGEFPRPVRIGPGAVGWRLGDVMAWLDSRPAA